MICKGVKNRCISPLTSLLVGRVGIYLCGSSVAYGQLIAGSKHVVRPCASPAGRDSGADSGVRSHRRGADRANERGAKLDAESKTRERMRTDDVGRGAWPSSLIDK